jgi:hypothetical protein
VERLNLSLIYILISSFIFSAGCNGGGGFGGDRDASVSLLPTTKSFKMSKEDPKKLQMVIIADPTGSMEATQKDLYQYLPGFTQELLNSGFVFEIFCSTTSYTGATMGEIISIKSSVTKSASDLQAQLTACINTELTDTQIGDERGLEAAQKTWSKIIENKLLDPTAVKLTMIITNEDDCSRDLGKYPSDENVANRCIDQNVTSSPVEGIKGGKFPITDYGYAEDPKPLENFPGLFDHPVLFPVSKYSEFFSKKLNYTTAGKADAVDQLLRQRGHIFAPVIMQPPAAVGKDKAYQCVNNKTKKAQQSGTSKVMSFGMRYFEVAESTKNKTYSLCEQLENVLQEINISVQNEVEVKRFILNRKPKNPADLKIKIRRIISDISLAKDVLDRMQLESSRSANDAVWTIESESKKKTNGKERTSQIWKRTLSAGNGFTYNPQTNEIIFNNSLYDSYNDALTVLEYEPAGLDGEVDYEQKN